MHYPFKSHIVMSGMTIIFPNSESLVILIVLSLLSHKHTCLNISLNCCLQYYVSFKEMQYIHTYVLPWFRDINIYYVNVQ